jgi:hypothetical protein
VVVLDWRALPHRSKSSWSRRRIRVDVKNLGEAWPGVVAALRTAAMALTT